MLRQASIFIFLLALLSHCQDPDSNAVHTLPKVLTRSVGFEISTRTAERWINHQRSQSASKVEKSAIAAEDLDMLLLNVTEAFGVILHHALDEEDHHHILIEPVREDLILWTNGNVFDATSNEFVDVSKARRWTTLYKSMHTFGPWSHYFGADIFAEITALQGFDRIEIVPAINDLDVPQLLLYSFYIMEPANGRSKNEEVKIYDGSAVCPPTCAGEL